MNLLLIVFVLGTVLIAERPDKAGFASRWVGAVAAFLIHVIIAVAAGSLMTLLPHRVLELEFVIAALFLAGALFMLAICWRLSRGVARRRAASTTNARRRSRSAVSSGSAPVIICASCGTVCPARR